MKTIDQVQAAYDAFAPAYDDFNAQNDYEGWFAALLPRLEDLGLRRGRLLDVACGTGRAFEPMLRRGWEITACDISPPMVARAEAKYPGEGIEYAVADMRELPVLGEFELIWALNDPVNYLIGDGDLQRAFGAMGANLGADGLLAFDCNTEMLFRIAWSAGENLDRDSRWVWEGRGLVDGVYESEISGEGIETNVHRQRHHSVAEVQRALRDAGLEPVAAIGQLDDGELVLSDDWDEERDHKIIHVARRG